MTQLTVIKTLKSPWKVGGTEALEIEFRQATVKDLTAAEQEANPTLFPNAFSVALAAETCIRAGAFTGPFAAAQFNSMSTKQFSVVRTALAEASDLGED